MASSSNKKVKGRYVPSKYKQSAENYTSLHTSSNTTSSTGKLSSRNQNTLNITKADPKNTHSTPETANTAPPNFDESSIPSASCTITDYPKMDRLRQKSLNLREQKKKNACVLNSTKQYKNTIKQREDNLEDELNLCYAEYQLNLLLENKARKSLQDKSTTVLEKIYGVFSYIQVLLGKHENIKNSLNVISFILELNEHLNKQEKMLVPYLEILDGLEKQYEEIAAAIDCVKHKLPVEEVMPLEGSEKEIIEIMQEIDNFLNVIMTNVGNVDEIVTSANDASVFIKKGNLVLGEIKSALELLDEARNLILSETSFKFASLIIEDVQT